MKRSAHKTRGTNRRTEWKQANEQAACLEEVHRPIPATLHLHVPLNHSLALITVKGQQHKHGKLGGWLTRIDGLC